MFALSLDEHVAGAASGNRLNEYFISGMVSGPAALDYECAFSGSGVIQIATDDLLDRIGKSDHGGDTLCGFYFTDPVAAQG
jgi:hypothetical protein